MIRKFIIFCIKAGVLLGTIGGFIGAYLVFYYTRDLPDYSQLAKYHPPLATRMYSLDGKLIEQYAIENRIFVPLESVPDYLVQAFISAEDKHFYTHEGIDLLGVVRAAFSNVGNVIKNKRLEGASTITQQVVKNFLLSNERSIGRKVKEAVLSYMVSKTFSKQQILELYLNQTFFGKGAYGVAVAAQTYFNKSVEDLTIAEAAFIAGLPKAPSSFDPIKNYERSKERRDYVINRMLEDGYIKVEQAKEALATPITLKKRNSTDLVKAGYFAEHVRNVVIDMYGETEFYTGGLTIITTMDSELQKDAEAALVDGIRKFVVTKGYKKPIANVGKEDPLEGLNKIQEQINQRDYLLAVVTGVSELSANILLKDGTTSTVPLAEVKWARGVVKTVSSVLSKGDVIAVEKVGNHYGLRQIPEVNGGMVVEDPISGAIRAHVGGYDYVSNKYDRVTQAQRQPGSTVKTFVFLSALEHGVAPNTIYDDAPITISQGKGMPSWTPKNFEGGFLGPITFRTALEKSRNLVTVRLAKQVGLNSVAEIISRLGINSNPPHYYSMILGALETTLSKMANSFSTIANGGMQVMPHYIEMIQDRNGKIIYRRDSAICKNCESNVLPIVEREVPKRLVDSQSAYQLTSILSGAAIRGTSHRLGKFKIPIAAKTGTTNKGFDAWNIAYTPDLVFGTYIGYDNPRSMGNSASGATVAVPVIEGFLTRAINKITHREFDVPEGIELVSVDKTTGQRSSGANSIMEAFKIHETHEPIKHEDSGELEEDVMFEDKKSMEEKIEFYENIGEVY